MINWKQKLSSRKFWAAVIGFVTSLLILFGVKEMTVERATALITAFGTLVAYIFAEAYVDGKRNPDGTETEENPDGGEEPPKDGPA